MDKLQFLVLIHNKEDNADNDEDTRHWALNNDLYFST